MQTSLEAEIAERLARYLADETALRDFQVWFSAATWDVHEREDERATDLAGEIELSLDEYTSGHLDEGELRDEFGRLLSRGPSDLPTSSTTR